jgi:hypothetical protein
MFCVTKSYLQHLSIILHAVSKNNMWASHGLDKFCVRPYSVIGPELQVTIDSVPWLLVGCVMERLADIGSLGK